MDKTSLDIARVFGRHHDSIVRTIERMNIPDKWHKRLFRETTVIRKTGGKERTEKGYKIAPKGAVLLIMGLGCPKAMLAKLSYIEALKRCCHTNINLSVCLQDP